MENSKIEQLLSESIAASNRTTHAVRAFVRFLFIQLVGITAAFFLNSLATSNVDPVRCAYSGENCEPLFFVQFLAFAIWITAVIWSSTVGWRELELSEIKNAGSVKKTESGAPVSYEDSDSKEFPTCPFCGWTKTQMLIPCNNCGK